VSGVQGERFAAQLLTGEPATDPVAVAERVLAVQGQDPRGFRLAVRARTRGLTARDVDAALDAGTLVVSWLNRGTLHLVRAADYWRLFALTTPQIHTAVHRRLAQEGVTDPDRAVAAVARAVAGGPRTRAELAEAVASAGVRTEGQALIQVLALAALRGVVVRGPVRGKQHAYVPARDWLGAPPPTPDRDADLAWLARRYLAGHGPASDRDLAKWAGLPLRDARRALAAVADDLAARADGLAALRDAARPAGVPPPRLLGSFDPVLHGWASREPVLGEHDGAVVGGGMFRPFALVRGRGVATWRYDRGTVSVEPFAALSARDRAALDRDAEDVRRYLG
jgi:hypothetical protein